MSEVQNDSVQLIVTSPSEVKLISLDWPLNKLSPLDQALSATHLSSLLNVFKATGFPFLPPRFFRECHRVLRSDGVFLWNLGYSCQDFSSMFGAHKINCLYPYLYSEYILSVSNFLIQDDFIWVKEPPGLFHERDNIVDSFEHFFLFTKSENWKFHPEWKQFRTAWIESAANVLEVKRKMKDLPAPFSEPILRLILNTFTDPGDTVLDPLAGTGTLGKVAVRMGRNVILYEIKEELREIIVATIEEE